MNAYLYTFNLGRFSIVKSDLTKFFKKQLCEKSGLHYQKAHQTKYAQGLLLGLSLSNILFYCFNR